MKSFASIILELDKTVEHRIDISKIISKQRNVPISVVKKAVSKGLLTINNKPFYRLEIEIRPWTTVKFQGVVVDLVQKEKNHFDRYVEILAKELGIEDLFDIRVTVKRTFCAYLIAYFEHYSFDKLDQSTSEFFGSAMDELEAHYKETHREARMPRRKELVETLVKLRTNTLKELNDLVNSLVNGFFTKTLFKFLQEHTRVVNNEGFQLCIAPLLSASIFNRTTLEALIKIIHDAQNKVEIDEKYQLFEQNNDVFKSYLNLIKPLNSVETSAYGQIGEFLYALFRRECETLESKPADILVLPTSRKYNFSNPEREYFPLYFSVQNNGDGLARELRFKSLSDAFQFDDYTIGSLKPGESREISIHSRIKNYDPSLALNISCCWMDGTNAEKVRDYSLKFANQDAEVPWELLERRKPYTIQEIDEREKLYGRDEILRELKANIVSDKIESYKLWGQKRVGKSSIVKTLKTLFNEDEKTVVIWRSIAGLKNTDPILTLNTLGESLCSEIFEELNRKISDSSERDRFRSVQVPEFNGSLFPLESYINKLRRLDSSLRFVFLLDEFDRINEEFFLPGNLGDSFSLNIGKGLSTINYVGFILVGSENMHLLNRQEINYNSFQGREIDTFDKKREFDSFKKIVTGPVTPYIIYSDESIERIYDVTNGNPYFSNLICSYIFRLCSKYRDTEVDIHTTNEAINIIVESSNKSHFEHFWGDGITDESNVKKERKSDIRRRLLVSYSFSHVQAKKFPTKEQIIRNFKRPSEYLIENYEIENTITEFYNRKIFFDEGNGLVRIKPHLFEMWLCGPGRTLMIEGISDLEALQKEKQLEKEHELKLEELQRVCEKIVFKGNRVKISDLKNYFNQFGSPFEQRRIFNIVDSIFYIPKVQIAEFIAREKKNIFRKNELEIKSTAKTPYRESIELFSFSSSVNENSDLAETFKRLSLIRSTKTLKDLKHNKDAWKSSGADDIIILESVIDSFSEIQQELNSFFDARLIEDVIPVKLFVLVITTKAKADIIRAMSPYSNFKLIHLKEVEENQIKPFIDNTSVFETRDEISFAFAEVRKHFRETEKEALNVLFETHCPSKSVPILWHSTRQFHALFPNPHGSLPTTKSKNIGEEYRDRVYHANREFIQAINPFIIDFLKSKASSDGVSGDDNWFRRPYLPDTIVLNITKKWMEENCVNSKETYFDLIDYKEIIKKHKEIQPVFKIQEKGGNGFEWLDKLNELRRDPAHPEKPPPSLEQTEYFEEKKDEILKRIRTFINNI